VNNRRSTRTSRERVVNLVTLRNQTTPAIRRPAKSHLATPNHACVALPRLSVPSHTRTRPTVPYLRYRSMPCRTTPCPTCRTAFVLTLGLPNLPQPTVPIPFSPGLALPHHACLARPPPGHASPNRAIPRLPNRSDACRARQFPSVARLPRRERACACLTTTCLTCLAVPRLTETHRATAYRACFAMGIAVSGRNGFFLCALRLRPNRPKSRRDRSRELLQPLLDLRILVVDQVVF
jgi:hypothetical protein